MVSEHDHQRIARNELDDVLRENLQVVADGVQVGAARVGDVRPADRKVNRREAREHLPVSDRVPIRHDGRLGAPGGVAGDQRKFDQQGLHRARNLVALNEVDGVLIGDRRPPVARSAVVEIPRRVDLLEVVRPPVKRAVRGARLHEDGAIAGIVEDPGHRHWPLLLHQRIDHAIRDAHAGRHRFLREPGTPAVGG